jgi:hypothetical protein
MKVKQMIDKFVMGQWAAGCRLLEFNVSAYFSDMISRDVKGSLEAEQVLKMGHRQQIVASGEAARFICALDVEPGGRSVGSMSMSKSN